MTPLHYAAGEGRQSVVESLIKCKADITSFDEVASWFSIIVFVYLASPLYFALYLVK